MPVSPVTFARSWLIAVWLQFVILTSYATYLSLTPDPGDIFVSIWDKLLHVSCWFVLLLSLYVASRRAKMPWGYAVALFLYSSIVEGLQSFSPERQVSAEDLLANGLGILFAYGFTFLISSLYQRLILSPLRRLSGYSSIA